MAHALAVKLFWLWISLIATVLTFWRLRRMWLKHHPEPNKRAKYSQRLANRLRDRQMKQLQARRRKPRPHR
jgi:hypothetical protein